MCFAATLVAQVPLDEQVRILAAEDERRYDGVLTGLMKHSRADVRRRAALAAGRIGDAAAVPALAGLLGVDPSTDVRAMAAFAIGEVESSAGAEAILTALAHDSLPAAVRARAVEAAGKIAAANAKDASAAKLGEAILDTLEAEHRKGGKQDLLTVRLGLTAVLRARPVEGEIVTARFLTNLDAGVRGDAGNTLARLRAKNANVALRAMLMTDDNPIARANAARALGAAEDAGALQMLIDAATEDEDARVRVSAIRSLVPLKDVKAAEDLMAHGEKLMVSYKASKAANPAEKSELLEVATALGRLLADTRNERAGKLLTEFSLMDKGYTPEIAVARFRVAPGRGDHLGGIDLTTWQHYRTLAAVIGEFATLESSNEEAMVMKGEAPDKLRSIVVAFLEDDSEHAAKTILAAPDLLRAFARFKTDDLSSILRRTLAHEDVFLRTAAAELLGEQPASEENSEALRAAFAAAMKSDLKENDAQLAILSAMVKTDKAAATETLGMALGASDNLVRVRAAELIKANELAKSFAGFEAKAAGVRRHDGKAGTKLGQIVNTEADYRRAASRKNGTVRAVLTTEKGTFGIDLLPEDAPLTVDNFIKLANANYFNGLEVHRVVPNFVIQDGDPIGNGSGGPGWTIRCEINMVAYERGFLGMALSGKDTGGSQWFVTHSPQPHLDGGYTVFGKVNETDMKVVDSIVRGDKILTVRIVGN